MASKRRNYSDAEKHAILDGVFKRLSEGVDLRKQVADDPQLPSRNAIYTWIDKLGRDEDHARARRSAVWDMYELAHEIAMADAKDMTELRTQEKKINWLNNSMKVFLPAIFGDKTQIDMNVTQVSNPEQDMANLIRALPQLPDDVLNRAGLARIVGDSDEIRKLEG